MYIVRLCTWQQISCAECSQVLLVLLGVVEWPAGKGQARRIDVLMADWSQSAYGCGPMASADSTECFDWTVAPWKLFWKFVCCDCFEADPDRATHTHTGPLF